MSFPKELDAFEQFQKILHENQENIESPKSDFLRTCYKLMKAFPTQVEFPKPLELIECTTQYIQYLFNYCENCDVHKLRWPSVNRLFQCISDVFSSRNMKDLFVRLATRQVLDLILAPSIHTWPKKKLLNMFNAIVQGSTRAVRAETLATIGNMYLYKLFDLLDICGDYEHQTMVLETILRMCDKSKLKSTDLEEVFPHSAKLCKAFMGIDIRAFEEDARTFLNAYNMNNPKIFSVLCCWIRLDELILKQSTETTSSQSIWMDFDLVDHTLSWSCDKNSMTQDLSHTNHWETVHVRACSVEKVKISRSGPNRQCLIATLTLNGACVPLNETARCALKEVKVLTFCTVNSRTINHLILEVFPILFGKKYSKTTLGHRNIYNKRSVPKSSISISISNSTSSCKSYSKTPREVPVLFESRGSVKNETICRTYAESRKGSLLGSVMSVSTANSTLISEPPREVPIGAEARSSLNTDTSCISYAGSHEGSLPGSVITISSSNCSLSCKPLSDVPIGIESKNSENTEIIFLSHVGNHAGQLTDNVYKPCELTEYDSYCDRGSVADTVLHEEAVHIVPEVPSLVQLHTKDTELVHASCLRIETASTISYNNELFLEKGMKNLTKQQVAEEVGNKSVYIRHESEKSKTHEPVLGYKNNEKYLKKSVSEVAPRKRVRNGISKAKQSQTDLRKQKKTIRTAISQMQRDFERVHGKPLKNAKPFTYEQALERFEREIKLCEQINESRRPKQIKNKSRKESRFETKETINYGENSMNCFNFEWEDILKLLKKDMNSEIGKEATHKQNQELRKTQNILNETSVQGEGQKKYNTGRKRKISNNAVQPSKQKCYNTGVNPTEKINIISDIRLHTKHI